MVISRVIGLVESDNSIYKPLRVLKFDPMNNLSIREDGKLKVSAAYNLVFI